MHILMWTHTKPHTHSNGAEFSGESMLSFTAFEKMRKSLRRFLNGQRNALKPFKYKNDDDMRNAI